MRLLRKYSIERKNTVRDKVNCVRAYGLFLYFSLTENLIRDQSDHIGYSKADEW